MGLCCCYELRLFFSRCKRGTIVCNLDSCCFGDFIEYDFAFGFSSGSCQDRINPPAEEEPKKKNQQEPSGLMDVEGQHYPYHLPRP